MTSQERRLVRKWKRDHPDQAANLSRSEILRIIQGKSSSSKVKVKDKKRRRDPEDIPTNPMEDQEFTVRDQREIPDGARCWVCGEEVEQDDRATGIIVHIGGDKFYHKRGCGPNNIKWVLGHPDQLSLLVYVDANRERNGGGVERLREFKQMFYPDTIMAWTADQVIHYLRWEKAGFPLAYNVDRKAYVGPKIIEEGTDPADAQDSTIYREDYQRKKKHKIPKEERIMAKKVEETKKSKKAAPVEEEKKTGKGSGLIPKEAVVVPKELFKHKKIGALLKEMTSTDDDARKREIRRMLRAEGFKLSDESTWKPFLKAVGKGAADDDDEEEDEAPKKKAGKKEKDVKKGKKKFEELEDEDEEEEDQDDDEEEDDEEEEEEKPKKSKKGKK